MSTEPTDAMLDDLQHRRDVADEERRTLAEETDSDDPDVEVNEDEARADDPCADDGLGDY